MFILAMVLLCFCILWKEKKPLQINYWLGVACVPAFLCYMFIPFSIGNDSFHYAVDGTNLFYNLPFAKKCSPHYNQQVLYKVDTEKKKVIFTPRSEYFWEYHKDDGIAEKIHSFQTMPIQDHP